MGWVWVPCPLRYRLSPWGHPDSYPLVPLLVLPDKGGTWGTQHSLLQVPPPRSPRHGVRWVPPPVPRNPRKGSRLGKPLPACRALAPPLPLVHTLGPRTGMLEIPRALGPWGTRPRTSEVGLRSAFHAFLNSFVLHGPTHFCLLICFVLFRARSFFLCRALALPPPLVHTPGPRTGMLEVPRT